MKTIVILATVLAVVVAIPSDTYNPALDNFDAEQFKNQRFTNSFLNCLLEKGPCTAEGHDIKKMIPDALNSNCAKCSPKQRKLIRTAIGIFKNNHAKLWDELVKKEDPKGEHKETLEKFINSSD